MNNKYPLLTSPIQLGKVTFRNRIFSAPMGATDITADCCPGPRTQGFYELRAKGGAAAVTVSELVVHPETDASHMLHLDLETVGCLAAHTFVADAIRSAGMEQCPVSSCRTPDSMPERIWPTRTRKLA